jgi:hypothetical protein
LFLRVNATKTICDFKIELGYIANNIHEHTRRAVISLRYQGKIERNIIVGNTDKVTQVKAICA